MIKGIIFDKDGTLFDFQATWGVWAGDVLRLLANGDLAQFDALARAVNYDAKTQTLRPGSVVIAGTPMQICEALVPVSSHTIAQMYDIMHDASLTAPQMLVPGLMSALKVLHGQGMIMAVMTNDSEAPARANLAQGGIDHFFGPIIGSDSGHGAKPDPDPLLAIAEHWAMDPQHILMVGDSLHDLHAATAAGMGRIGVLTGMATRDDLAAHADAVLDTAAQLPHHLAQTAA